MMRSMAEVEAEVYEVLAASMEPDVEDKHMIAFGGAMVALMWVMGTDAYGRPSVFAAPKAEVA